jgi:DNA-binding response OmpR family regulator
MAEREARTILIVEDDEPTRRLLTTIVTRDGHLAEFANNGWHAIQALSARNFDAVILDLMMPDVDGRAVIDHIDRSAIRPPVIVCTAAGPTVTSKIDSPSVRAVIRKPFEVDELRRIIAEVLT